MKWSYQILKIGLIAFLSIWLINVSFFQPAINKTEKQLDLIALTTLQNTNKLIWKNTNDIRKSVYEVTSKYRIDDTPNLLAIDTVLQVTKDYIHSNNDNSYLSLLNAPLINLAHQNPIIADEEVSMVMEQQSSGIALHENISQAYQKEIHALKKYINAYRITNFLASKISIGCFWWRNFNLVGIYQNYVPKGQPTEIQLLLTPFDDEKVNELIQLKHNQREIPVTHRIGTFEKSFDKKGNHNVELEATLLYHHYKSLKLITDTITIKDTLNIYVF